jgi:hypothetical protein
MKVEAWLDRCDKMEGAGAVREEFCCLTADADWEHFQHER